MSILYESSDPVICALYALSIGPDSCFKRYNKLIYNGVRFHTLDFDRRKKTQNSGVLVEGGEGDAKTEFYGVLTDIYEFTYVRNKRVFLFKCKWWDTNETHRHVRVHDGFKSIKVTRTWYDNDPYVLASQVKQIFYLDDMSLGADWRVVQQFEHRHIYNIDGLLGDTNVFTDVEARLADESVEEHFMANEERVNEHHPVMDCDVDVSLRIDISDDTIDEEVIERMVERNEDDGGDVDEEEEPDDTLIDYDCSDDSSDDICMRAYNTLLLQNLSLHIFFRLYRALG